MGRGGVAGLRLGWSCRGFFGLATGAIFCCLHSKARGRRLGVCYVITRE